MDSFDYINPAAGEPRLFPTISFRAQLLNEGSTDPHFYNGTEVCFVIEGQGVIHVGDEALEWNERDIFVVSPDEIPHHEPNDEAILLGMTDRPVFNFYAEPEPS